MAFYLCNSASNDIIDEANATDGDKRSQQIPETYISDIRSYDNVLIVEKGDGSTSSVEFESFIDELEIPTVSTALTYNGNPQSPNFSNYFPYKMTISGTLSAIEDGIYEVAFTPNAGYVWVDNKKYPGLITPLDVTKEYRGYGVGNRLLYDAIHKYGAIDLCVDKDNEIAIHLYKKHGFVIIGDGESKKQYWMKLKTKLTAEEKSKAESIQESKASSKPKYDPPYSADEVKDIYCLKVDNDER